MRSVASFMGAYRDHGTPFYRCVMWGGLKRWFDKWGQFGSDVCSARAVVDDFGDLVVMEGWS